MNFLISFSQASLPSGTAKIDFDSGIVTDSAGTQYNLSGNIPSVESITILTSVATTLQLEGTLDSIVYLPAARYFRIKTNIENIKIVSTAVYNLWFAASTEPTGSPEVT